MQYSRFHPLHPRASLRRLRTAFGPSSPTSPSSSSTSSTSPLSASVTASSSSSNFAGFNFELSNVSTISLSEKSQARRVIRRKKSLAEVEQEEERNGFADELVALVEPRPRVGPSLGGIQEVLEGRI